MPLNHIFANREGNRVAVIVNDLSEVNIDAEPVMTGDKFGETMLDRVDEKMVELSNGCICCTLREDLLKEVSRLAREKKFDYRLIEGTGIAAPLPIAQTFTFEDEAGRSLAEITRLDTMITVVDAFNFIKNFETEDDRVDRGTSCSNRACSPTKKCAAAVRHRSACPTRSWHGAWRGCRHW